jgi:hypothetical protein
VHDYRLHTRRGIIGPVKLDTVRDLADAGLVRADTLAERDDGPLVPVSALPELSSLVPHDGQGEPSYSGDLAVVSFMRILQRLYGNRVTGLLLVRDATRRKDVYLEDGRPIFVASTIGKERLGEFLMAKGRISAAELRTALAAAQAEHEPLGASLARLSILESSEVDSALREQQTARLVDLCAWEHGRYAFYDGSRYEGARVDLQIDTPWLWVVAARHLPERVILRRLGDVLHQVVSGVDAQAVDLCIGALTAEERAVATLFDGEHSAVEIVTAESGTSSHRRSVLTVLYLFWELGALRFRSRKSPGGIEGGGKDR